MAKYYIIGAGISGLLTALHLHTKGHDVSLIAKQPDPRTKKSPESGATSGGGETRMATLTEGHAYLGHDSLFYPDMPDKFRTTVENGGWLDKPLNEYTRDEQIWLLKRSVADNNKTYIDRLNKWYADVNYNAINQWFELKKHTPVLFDDIGFVEGVVRCEETEEKFNFAHKRYSDRHDALRKSVKNVDVHEDYPHLTGKHIGGVVGITGFSFRIHKFVENCLSYLEEDGVEIQFDTELTDLELDANHNVSALILMSGHTIRTIENPENVSLHMGAYDQNKLLAKTSAAGKIMGVAGIWAIMDRPKGMKRSMKMHFGRDAKQNLALTDINLILRGLDTPDKDGVIVGTGYIFNGENPTTITEASRKATKRGVMNALHKAMHNFDEQALNFRFMDDKLCTRSFTYDDLPLFETMKTTGGGTLIISGGENTGTTSMAPQIARMVEAMSTEAATDSETQSIKLEYLNIKALSDKMYLTWNDIFEHYSSQAGLFKTANDNPKDSIILEEKLLANT